MEDIILPNNLTFEKDDERPAHRGRVIVEPLYPGYGETIANSLRRVLLSSLPGFAVYAIKIDGVDHEFSAIDGVKEDVIEIILNMKKIRFNVHSVDHAQLKLTANGEGVVTAGDIDAADNVEVVNPEQEIATLTSKDAKFEMDIFVDQGRGYVPVEQRDHQKPDVGLIAIDSVYTPVVKVSFDVDNMRVGQQTNFDKVIMDIETDGTITPEDALKHSANILVNHYTLLQGDLKAPEPVVEVIEEEPEEDEDDQTIAEMKFSTRTFNALQKNGIHTLSQLVKRTEDDLLSLDGFGKTALEEVKSKLGAMDMELPTE